MNIPASQPLEASSDHQGKPTGGIQNLVLWVRIVKCPSNWLEERTREPQIPVALRHQHAAIVAPEVQALR